MGTAYKIHCKHCGTHFNYSRDESYGTLPRCVGCGSTYIDILAGEEFYLEAIEIAAGDTEKQPI